MEWGEDSGGGVGLRGGKEAPSGSRYLSLPAPKAPTPSPKTVIQRSQE